MLFNQPFVCPPFWCYAGDASVTLLSKVGRGEGPQCRLGYTAHLHMLQELLSWPCLQGRVSMETKNFSIVIAANIISLHT